MHLIVNPTAGRGRGVQRVPGIAAELRAAGNDVAVHETTAPGHAAAIAAGVGVGDTVVAVGGDGTAHELLPACLALGLRLGLIPAGSGDDLAHALGLDRHDTAAAVAVLTAGRERRIDVGVVNGEPFVNAFGVGFDADVARRMAGAPRAFRGLGRYLYGIVTAMRDFRLSSVRVEVDGKLVFAGPSLLVAVQNGPRTGGSFRFAPGAQLDDGVLEVVIAGAFDRVGTFGILPKVMRGAHLGHPKVALFPGRRVNLAWTTVMPAHAEGEQLTPSDRFAVDLRPAALRVLAP